MLKKIFFTSLLAIGFLFTFAVSSQAGDCGTAGVYEGICKDINDCSDYYTSPDVGCNFTGEVCCKGSTTPSGSSCTDGSKTGTCEDSSNCKTKITDRDGKCPGQVCCTEKTTTSGFSCTDGSKTGTCEDSSNCKTKITDRDGKCPGQVCCTEKISGGSTTDIDGIDLPSSSETGLTDRSILEIVSTILGWLLKIFLLLATIAFVVTGLQFLFALGNSYGDSATSAKKNFAYSIIALVVVGAGYIIILTIDMLLKG